jgi:hypothetical protein
MLTAGAKDYFLSRLLEARAEVCPYGAGTHHEDFHRGSFIDCMRSEAQSANVVMRSLEHCGKWIRVPQVQRRRSIRTGGVFDSIVAITTSKPERQMAML